MQRRWNRSCVVKIRHSLLALHAFVLLLCGCASMTTVKLQPTDTIRNSIITDSSEIIFHEQRKSGTRNPNLEIKVERRATKVESFQRRYIEKRVARLRTHLGLWVGGILAGSLGYLVYDQGYVVLGRDLMGSILIVPLAGAAVASKELGEQWKPETRKRLIQAEPAANQSIVVSVGDRSWIANTDDKGLLNFDISDLVDMTEPGGPLTINLQSKEDTTQKVSFSVKTSVVAFYRTPPVAVVTAVGPAVSFTTETGDAPTLAIIDFEGLGISEQDARVLTNRLGTHLVQLGRYQVIERGQMQQVLEEQDFQLTGCTSDECAVEVGQLLGVRQMLAGSFGKFGTIYTIDMRIIDVATGGILRTTSYDVQGEAELLLTVGLAEAARRIAGVD